MPHTETDDLRSMIERARHGDASAFGAAPSPLDDRTFIAYPPDPGAPDQVTVKGVGTCPVYAQQGSTCTGYAVAAALTYLEYAETGVVRTFDGAELHHRLIPSWSDGLWPTAVLDDVKDRGAEAQYDASSSALYRIGGYAGVPLDPDSVLTALATTGPLVLVTWLGDLFYQQWYDRTDAYLPAPANKDEQGLHAMIIVAADRAKGVVIQNNWGVEGYPDSGDKILGGGGPYAGIKGGFHKASWEWLRMQAWEAWAVADVSNATGAGWIRTHSQPIRAGGFALAKRPDRPAVYALLGETRDWISSQQELYARGLGGLPINVIDKSDPVWGYPVVGADAPEGQRA